MIIIDIIYSIGQRRLIKQGYLQNAQIILSPNCDDRPDGEQISLLVIHNISLPPKQFGGQFIDDLFLNRLDIKQHTYFESIAHLRVSSHVLIERNGSLKQFVSFYKRAWHAGISCYQGQDCCNDFSIGIELEGSDEIAYTLEQYQCLAMVVKEIIKKHPLIKNNIVGHSDIAPGRKTDPGKAFDWAYFKQQLDLA